MLKTVKFGGSSVSGAAQFAKVKDIVTSDPARRLVVTSAAGKRTSADHKITDLLYLCHAHLTYGVSCADILADVLSRFVEIRDGLKLSYPVEEEFNAYAQTLNRDTNIDELVSRGEFFTAKMLAEYLNMQFIDAKDCIFFGYDGLLDKEKTYKAIADAFAQYGALVIPGFYGSLPSGKIHIMSRGGSDITGALVAAATDCDVYENWTDVSGILMADPRIVKDPRPIKKITFAELRELSFLGASVLHEDSILPVKEAGIALNIRNTNAASHPGTMIVEKIEKEEKDKEKFLTGVTGRRNFDILTVRKRNMSSNETLRNALNVLDIHHIPCEHITLGLDTFALVVPQASFSEKMYEVISDLKDRCNPDDVSIQDNIALVAAVGRKMGFRPGVSGKLFNSLGKNGINIRTIAQGADELSIIIGVDNTQFESAIRILYEEFAD